MKIPFALLVSLALGACTSDPTTSGRSPEQKQSSGAKPATPVAAPASASSRSFVRIDTPGEPGEALEVSGRVFEPDGTTPAAGVVLYVYHTGADGIYTTERDAPPRLRAWLVTDAEGRYRYRTIKPGPYPANEIAAHVHTQLWSARFPAQYGTELLFEGDPFLTAREIETSKKLGSFAYIAHLERGKDGVLRTTHDLRLEATGDAIEDNTSHGVRDAPAELRPREFR